MSTVWKVLAALALVVPMGAYVVGSLAASASDDPAPRQTIEIREASTTPSPTQAPSSPTQTPTQTPRPERSAEVEVITPDYDDFDARDDNGDDDGDDHRGRGRGGSDHGGSDTGSGSGKHDDNSGHGGGDD